MTNSLLSQVIIKACRLILTNGKILCYLYPYLFSFQIQCPLYGILSNWTGW